MTGRVGVLMVTGAYYPEVSGGGLQCRALMHMLRDRVSFLVFTTTTNPALPRQEKVSGIPVYRIIVDVRKLGSKIRAGLRFIGLFLQHQRRFDIVHLHGFSRKSWLLIGLARLFRKPLVLKLTSAGDDDPLSLRRRGVLAYWFYRWADLYVGVSAGVEARYQAAGFPRKRFQLIPNGVDVNRFRPHSVEERQRLRRQLGLPQEGLLILFVGFFSREKCPDLLFEAWMNLQRHGHPQTVLVFVGATQGGYYEIDPALAAHMKGQVERQGLGQRMVFVERTHAIEQYYGAADCFVLPSVREGLPNTLLEAMASGLACIASRLPGITNTVIEDRINGLLMPPRSVSACEQALGLLLQHPEQAREMGRRARETIEDRYALPRIAERYRDMYHRMVSGDSQ